jgi:hypothetical protein
VKELRVLAIACQLPARPPESDHLPQVDVVMWHFHKELRQQLERDAALLQIEKQKKERERKAGEKAFLIFT